MKLAILGHGNVGGAIARGAVRKGYTVMIGIRKDRDEKAESLSNGTNITLAPMKEAVSQCEAVLVATPARAAVELIDALGPLEGKFVIDATNAVRARPEPYATLFHAFQARTGARVVKCFNTTGYENMLDPVYGAQALDLFMAGEDDGAKEVARRLALDLGFASCVDFGNADKVELLEHFAMAWINLAVLQGMGRGIGFKLLQRG